MDAVGFGQTRHTKWIRSLPVRVLCIGIVSFALKLKWLRFFPTPLREQIVRSIRACSLRWLRLSTLFGSGYTTISEITKKQPPSVPFAKLERFPHVGRPRFSHCFILSEPQNVIGDIPNVFSFETRCCLHRDEAHKILLTKYFFHYRPDAM